MAKFCKKPVIVGATQWFKNGDHPEDGNKSFGEQDYLCEGKVVRYYRRPDDSGERFCELCGVRMHDHGWIDYQGGHNVCPGDWIIKEPTGGGFYPCKPDVFEVTYERVEE